MGKKTMIEEQYVQDAKKLMERFISVKDDDFILHESQEEPKDTFNLPERLDFYNEADTLEDMIPDETEEEEIPGEEGLSYNPQDLEFLEGVWVGKVQKSFESEEEREAFQDSINADLQKYPNLNFRWLVVEEDTEQHEQEEIDVGNPLGDEETEEDIMERVLHGKDMVKEADEENMDDDDTDEELEVETSEEEKEEHEAGEASDINTEQLYLVIYDFDIIEEQDEDLVDYLSENFEKIDIFDEDYEFLAEKISEIRDEVNSDEEVETPEASTEETIETPQEEEEPKPETESVTPVEEIKTEEVTAVETPKVEEVKPVETDPVVETPVSTETPKTEEIATVETPKVEESKIDIESKKEEIRKKIRERIIKNKIKASLEEKRTQEKLETRKENIVSAIKSNIENKSVNKETLISNIEKKLNEIKNDEEPTLEAKMRKIRAKIEVKKRMELENKETTRESRLDKLNKLISEKKKEL